MMLLHIGVVRRDHDAPTSFRHTIWLFMVLVLGSAASVSSLVTTPVKPQPPPRPHPVKPESNTVTTAKAFASPTTLFKLERRARVFFLAGRMFFSYKKVQFQEKRLRRQLGVPSDEDGASDDDHPSIVKLWDAAHARNAARLLRGIEDLSGFWVKIGQYLSSRADVIPPQYLRTLSSLQDGLPTKPFEEILQTLAEEQTEEQMAMLAWIDPEPLSTASLAQVHRAELVDGQEVVIKVQHRGVASLMRQDMGNLRTILGLLARSDPNLDFGPVVDEYTAEVTKELDFRREAANMAQVKEVLEQCGICARVPDAIPKLVTERILTMDYCPGFSVRDVDQLDAHGVDRNVLLGRICEAWAVQMHVAGTFNADPHAGNILVSTAEPDGDASVPVLLDFGLTKRLSPEMKLAFARLVHAADESDVDSLLLSFDEMGLELNRYDPFEDMAAMRRSFSDTVPQSQAKEASKAKARDRKLREEAMREEQGVKKGGKLRNPVDAWPSELVFFTRVTAMLRGLCSRLEVRYPYLSTMAISARQALRDAVPPHERAAGPIHPSADQVDTPLQGRLRRIASELIDEGHTVGLQLCVISQGNMVANIAAGTLGTADPRPVTPSSLFNGFSVSKAVLAAGVHLLLEKEKISIDDPIAKHWPEFASLASKERITIRHALAHQAGLADAFPPDASIDLLTDWDQMKQFITGPEAVPSHLPGEETKYHYLSYAWILGGLMEAITGRPYEGFLLDHIMNPLGVSDEMFMGGLPDDVSSERLAVLTTVKSKPDMDAGDSSPSTSGKDEHKKKVKLEKFRGREQMLNPSVFNMRKVRAAKLPSANGHFSAVALATVFDALMVDAVDRGPLLSEQTVDAARSPQVSSSSKAISSTMLENAGASFGLGFQLHEIPSPDGKSAMRSIGHSGLGGSIVIGIPEMGLSLAFTTNQLSAKSIARDALLKAVFDEFSLQAPKSLIES